MVSGYIVGMTEEPGITSGEGSIIAEDSAEWRTFARVSELISPSPYQISRLSCNACEGSTIRAILTLLQWRLGRADKCCGNYVKFGGDNIQIERCDEPNNHTWMLTSPEREQSRGYRPLDRKAFQHANVKLVKAQEERRPKRLIERVKGLRTGNTKDKESGCIQFKRRSAKIRRFSARTTVAAKP